MNLLREFLDKTECIALLPQATPLERLSRLERLWRSSGLFIKRDDMTGIGLGGNKVRSLQYILGEAISGNFNKILVSGPGQSNLCMLTAAACAKLGLACEVIHNCEEPKVLTGNLLLNHLLGVKAHYLGQTDSETRNGFMEELGEKYRSEGERPYIIRNGATTGRGALGYAAAAAELQRQCKEQGIEDLTVFVPGGNGGVATGLIYGNVLIGMPFRVVVISVEDDEAVLLQHIEQTMGELVAITKIPLGKPVSQVCEIVGEYRGGGWGVNTGESESMIYEFAAQEGIFIENVYDSKVLVGMKHFVKEGKVKGNACYLHTGGLGSLFAQY